MKNKIENGLLFLIIGLIILLISGLIISTSSFFVEDYQKFTSNVIFFIIFLVVAILILSGGLLFLIGSMEFGVKHRKNVIYALIIFVGNIFFRTVLTSAILYIFVSGLAYTPGSSSSSFSFPILLLLIIMIVSVILAGLMYYFALIELEDEKGKKFLYAGIISLICISIIQTVYVFGTISSYRVSPLFTDFQSSGSIGILSVIPGILFIIALYIPYNRIKKGILTPQDLLTYKPAYGSKPPGRICPNCGGNIPFDAYFCSYCGKNFVYQNNHEIDNKNDKKIMDIDAVKVKGICPKCNKEFESEKIVNDDESVSANCNHCKAKLRMKK